jgi:parallel beta-helix repeat protein
VHLDSSNDNSIASNNITDSSSNGVYLTDSNNNSISKNTVVKTGIYGVYFGIYLEYSSFNNITANSVTNGYYGITLWRSNNNTVTGNNATDTDYCIYLWESSGNVIYHNNFVTNANLAYDWLQNVWDDGYPLGGNYWSQYSGIDHFSGPYQNITGSDGIGDTPYTSTGTLSDKYPLMRIWYPIPGDINSDCKAGLQDLVLLANAYGSRPNDTRWNPDADINGDGKISLADLVILANHYGQHNP